MYRCEWTVGGKEYCLYVEYDRHKCGGRINTVYDELDKEISSHNHLSNGTAIQARELNNKTKESATSQATPQ